MAQEAGALGGWSIAGSNRDDRFLIGMSEALGGLSDSDKWSAEVALDVDGESFDWRYIDDAAARFFRRFVRGEHQAVDAPEECGESFAGAGGGEDQR